MATENSSAGVPARNPQILEFGALIASVDFDLDAIRLEVTDPNGQGIATLLSLGQALDATVKLIGAIYRLRRLGDPT